MDQKISEDVGEDACPAILRGKKISEDDEGDFGDFCSAYRSATAFVLRGEKMSEERDFFLCLRMTVRISNHARMKMRGVGIAGNCFCDTSLWDVFS